MAVRVHKDSKNNEMPGLWDIDWYAPTPGGKKKKNIRVFEGTEAEAREFEMAVRRQYATEAPPQHGQLRTAWPTWMLHCQNNYLPTSYRDITYANMHLIPFFGDFFFTALNPVIIEQYKTARMKEKTPKGTAPAKRTVNKELTWFSAFLKWCAENGYCKPVPFKIKMFPKENKTPIRVPLPEEIEAMITHMEEEYLAIFLLYYDMGLRRSEALELTCERLFLNSGEIHVIGKGAKEAIIPITTDRLLEALKRAKERHPTKKGHLFINPKTEKRYYSIRKAIIRAAKKSGMDQRVYAHLFRHSFITHGIEAGVDMIALQMIGRHSDIRTTRGYMHMRSDFLRREVLKLFGGKAVTMAVTATDDKDIESQDNSDQNVN